MAISPGKSFRIRPRRFARTVWRSPARAWWRDHQWLVVWVCALLALGLGYIGFDKHFRALDQPRSFPDLLYLSLQLFILESGFIDPPMYWELNVARWLAPFVAGYTAVQALAVVFYEQFQWFRLRLMKNHVVVCGLGDKGLLMVKGLLDNDERVVVIEQNEANGFLEQCREQGAIIVLGDAADRETLGRARLRSARHIIALSGDDGVNAKIAAYGREFVKAHRTRSLTCLIHIADPQLYNLLRQEELFWEAGPQLRLEFFNVFDSGARRLLNEHPIFRESDNEAPGSTPRLIIIGLGQLGESLIVQAVSSWHARPTATVDRLLITIIDPQADQRKQVWRSRYPGLEATVEIATLSIDVDDLEFEQADFLREATSVYVCLDDERKGLSAALSLNRKNQSRKIPIIVCVAEDAGLGGLLRQNAGGLDNLSVFGLLSRTCNPDLLPGETHEILARLFHEEYVRRQQGSDRALETSAAATSWEMLSDEFKESNRLQADHITVKLGAVGCGIEPLTGWNANSFQFTSEEIELMARMEHERWMSERFLEGASYGPVRNDARKINPNLVRWQDLPDEIKDYNREAVREIPGFLERAGFQVYRLGPADL